LAKGWYRWRRSIDREVGDAGARNIMDKRGAEIYIDLTAISAELGATAGGKRGDWASSFVETLKRETAAISDSQLKTEVQATGFQPATSKSPDGGLVIGGVIISVMAASGYSIDPKKTTQIVQSVWKALKKILQKDTRVKLEIGSTKIDITTNSEDAARNLLRVGSEVAMALSSSTPTAKRKRVATLTPKKR
jgi:hypothetical protein